MEREEAKGTSPRGSREPSGGKGVVLNEAQLKSRRLRNYAIGLAVLSFIVLIYVVTIVRLGQGASHSPS
jgi:hypothetical protein